MNNRLIDTLQDARVSAGNPEGAFTMRDLVRETGRSQTTLRRELWELQEAGLLEVLRIKTLRIDGVWTGTVAYRIAESEDGPNT